MSLASKLLEVQTEVAPQIVFDSKNPHFKNNYVSLNKVLDVVLPALATRGVLLMQPLSGTGYEVGTVTTKFIDTESGETYAEATPLIAEKQTPQAVGSAITYFRRYSLLSALGLVGDEDDDAEAAMGNESTGSTSPSRSVSF